MTAPTDRAIDVRALAEQAGMGAVLELDDAGPPTWNALTRFARLVLEEAAKVVEAKFTHLPNQAASAATAIRRLAPEEGKP